MRRPAPADAFSTCGTRMSDSGANRLLTFETPLFRYKDFNRRVAFINAELEAVRAIPGVVNAGAINRIPFTNVADATFYWLEGQPRDNIPQQVALMRNVSRDYFATVGATLHEGRFFSAADQASKLPLAIVNEPFAARHFQGRSPLGQRFKFGSHRRKGLLVHDCRRREADPRGGRAGGDEARRLSAARTLRPDRRPRHRHRGSNGRRAGVDRPGGPSGDLVARQESAACAHPDDGRDRRPPAVDAFAEHGAVGRIRAARAAARIAGHLRRALLRRHPAHQRDRRPHGVGCDLQRDHALLRQTRPGADARRTRHRCRPGGDRVAPDDARCSTASAPTTSRRSPSSR